MEDECIIHAKTAWERVIESNPALSKGFDQLCVCVLIETNLRPSRNGSFIISRVLWSRASMVHGWILLVVWGVVNGGGFLVVVVVWLYVAVWHTLKGSTSPQSGHVSSLVFSALLASAYWPFASEDDQTKKMHILSIQHKNMTSRELHGRFIWNDLD